MAPDDSSLVSYDGGQHVRVEEHRLDQKTDSAQQTKQSRWGFRGKTVWNWLELLIVPLALAVIGLAFSVQQDARQQRVENQRAEAERELAVQRSQDEALQAYLDQMSTLMLEKDLRDSEEDSEVRTLARARTQTVIRRVITSRREEIMNFLLEADLVRRVGGSAPVITLAEANLHGVKLLGADLDDANLASANLHGANLDAADLSDADLTDAHGWTEDQLTEAKSLEGATMPNGQKYEEWLKSREEDREGG